MTENTKARPGEFDALEKARPDELIFTLLERDPCAPPTIAHWCELRRQRAREIKDDDKRKDELRQITEAEFIGFAMLDRQKARTKGDEVEALPVQTYSGVVAERTELDDLLPKLRAELSEADYHTNNALELARRIFALGDHGIDPFPIDLINHTALTIHSLALHLSPHRAALMAEAELPLDGSDANG